MSTGKQRTMEGEAKMEAAEESTTDLAVLASAASVLLAQYQFFQQGNKMRGIFIGLWPPTILAFASYFNQKRMEEKMKAMGPGRIVNSIEQMLGSR